MQRTGASTRSSRAALATPSPSARAAERAPLTPAQRQLYYESCLADEASHHRTALEHRTSTALRVLTAMAENRGGGLAPGELRASAAGLCRAAYADAALWASPLFQQRPPLPTPRVPSARCGRTRLMHASWAGSASRVAFLLACGHGGSLDAATQPAGTTALQGAASNSHEGVVRALLAAGAAPSLPDRYLRGPLHWAAAVGSGGSGAGAAVVRALLDGGADLEALASLRPDQPGVVEGGVGMDRASALATAHGALPAYTPLAVAAHAALVGVRGAAPVLRLLQERGAVVHDAARGCPCSPLLRVLVRAPLEGAAVTALLWWPGARARELGGALVHPTAPGCHAREHMLRLAVLHWRPVLLARLLGGAGGAGGAGGECEARATGSASLLAAACAAPPCGPARPWPVALAARQPHCTSALCPMSQALAAALLAAGAARDGGTGLPGASPGTPLLCAVLSGNLGALRALLAAGVDVRPLPPALHAAVSPAGAANVGVVSMLLSAGAEVLARDGEGRSALDVARGARSAATGEARLVFDRALYALASATPSAAAAANWAAAQTLAAQRVIWAAPEAPAAAEAELL